MVAFSFYKNKKYNLNIRSKLNKFIKIKIESFGSTTTAALKTNVSFIQSTIIPQDKPKFNDHKMYTVHVCSSD